MLEAKIKHYKNQNHINLAVTLVQLANANLKLKNYIEAKKLLDKALFIQNKCYGESHIDIASTFISFAELAYQENDQDSAKMYIDRASNIFDQHKELSPEHVALKRFKAVSNMIKKGKIL